MNKESAVKNISDMLISGKVAPWKAEQAALDEGISTPDNIYRRSRSPASLR